MPKYTMNFDFFFDEPVHLTSLIALLSKNMVPEALLKCLRNRL